MSWRQRYKRNAYPAYIGIGMLWNGRKQGRYWKRLLSKARRRSWRQGRPERGEPMGGYRGQAAAESTCNYKGW